MKLTLLIEGMTWKVTAQKILNRDELFEGIKTNKQMLHQEVIKPGR